MFWCCRDENKLIKSLNLDFEAIKRPLSNVVSIVDSKCILNNGSVTGKIKPQSSSQQQINNSI